MQKEDFIEWARKLQQTYVASEEVNRHLSQVGMLAMVGPTGVGKTTIINALGLPTVLSDVTRSMRPDEKNDLNYHFREDYLDILTEIKSGEYVQFLVSEGGDFYGTHASAYPNQGWCTMAIYATAIPDFRALGFKRVLPIYIMPPGYVEWMHRIGSLRTGDLDVRIAESITSIKTAMKDESYHFVLNDNLELAVADIKAILDGKEPDQHRARLAREGADILLERLGDQDDDMYFSNVA